MNAYLQKILGQTEQVRMSTRQHWVVLAQALLPELGIIVGLLVLTSAALSVSNAPPVAWGYALILLPLFSILRDVLIWRSHELVVTNRRVIQITGVLNKAVTDSSLEKVNDVKMLQSFLGRLLNYGDIEILTASELGVNRIVQLHNPVGFKKAMLDAKSQMHEDIPALLARLKSLHEAGVLTDEEFAGKRESLEKRS